MSGPLRMPYRGSRLCPARRLLRTLFMEPGSLVMERKMLLGIRQRAERVGPPQPVEESLTAPAAAR